MIYIASQNDLNALMQIEQNVFFNDSFALSKQSMRYHLKNSIIYYIKIDEKIAGYILWLKRKTHYRLYSLAIDSSYQNQGLASQLLEYSFKHLKNKYFSLEVKERNEKAIKLYEKYGFKISKKLPSYYDDCDGLKMIKQRD